MRDSNDRSVLMKPEGSRKVAVLNGSRQLDQVIGGQWTTLKVLPENGLPKGIYQLADAKQPATTVAKFYRLITMRCTSSTAKGSPGIHAPYFMKWNQRG